MPIALRCSRCQKETRVRDELAGRKVHCPGCHAALVVPGAERVQEVPEKPGYRCPFCRTPAKPKTVRERTVGGTALFLAFAVAGVLGYALILYFLVSEDVDAGASRATGQTWGLAALWAVILIASLFGLDYFKCREKRRVCPDCESKIG